MEGVPGGEWVEVPEDWERIAFFGRLLEAGLCRHESLVREPADGGFGLAEVFGLQRMLDWRMYRDLTLAERRKG